MLIAEDNLYNVVPIRTLLNQSMKIRTDRAMNGKKAVEMYQNDLQKKCCDVRYQLILMDINMPVMGGIAATQKIKAIQQKFRVDSTIPETVKKRIQLAPILAMTASNNKKMVSDCKDAGMTGMMGKPVNKKVFLS